VPAIARHVINQVTALQISVIPGMATSRMDPTPMEHVKLVQTNVIPVNPHLMAKWIPVPSVL